MIENRTRFICSSLHSYTLKVDLYFYGNLGDFSFLLLQDLNKKYDLTVAKTINLNSVERPCYEGEDYNDQEYLRLAEMIRTEVGCTSPFVPPQLREGLEVCSDPARGRLVQDLLLTNLASLNPNMWSSDFYFVPPCVFYEFSLKEFSRKPPGWVGSYVEKLVAKL